MKKIKVSMFIILISAGFLFNGEFFMLYQDNFENSYYQADFYPGMVEDKSSNQILNEFKAVGEKFNVDFFVVNREYKSELETDITVYGTEKVKEELKRKGVLVGKQKSIFFGNTEVNFVPISQIEDIKKYETFYFLGDASDLERLHQFKAELVGEYDGGFPKKFGSDRELWLNFIFVWGVIFGMIAIATVYACLYQKKENAVKVVMGESLSNIFLHNCIWDVGIFVFLFTVIPYILSALTNTYFKYGAILLALTFFLCMIVAINTIVLHMNFKKDLSDSHFSRKLIVSAYVLKMVMVVGFCLILCGNLVMIREGYNLYLQKDFFEAHKDYHYCRISYKLTDDSNEDTFYNEIRTNQTFYQKFQRQALQYADLTDNFNAPYPVLLHNRSAMKEISGQWNAIAEVTKNLEEGGLYLFVPSDLPRDTEAYKCAKKIGEAFFGAGEFGEIKTISYDGEIFLTGIHCDRSYRMRQYKNPILLYYNADFQLRNDLAGYDGYYWNDTMYKIDDTAWDAFLKDHKLEDQVVSKTNVQEVYLYNLQIAKRNIRMGLVLSCFLFFMELGLISFIIRSEYQLRAVEMALRKVNGYTLLQRNKRIVGITIISTCIGMAVGMVVSAKLGMPGGAMMLWIGISLLTIELIYILRKAIWMERLKITTILKGERI